MLSVVVDKGPAGNNVNRLYTDVTICQPGSTTACQTIDHVLIDTGSTGLRLLSSVVSTSLSFPKVNAPGGKPLLGCAQFLDNSFMWGSIVTADVKLAGETAPGLSVQIVADPNFIALEKTCSTGQALDTVDMLGAKGIIGMSHSKEDCGSACVSISTAGVYYTCGTQACTTAVGSQAPIQSQVRNPIALFASDNNGFVIDLPAVGPDGAVSITGSMIFGLGTQPNNQITTNQVVKNSSSGYFSTLLSGQSFSNSFIDTGSNGIYFDFSKIPVCSGNGFYCPSSIMSFSATQTGANNQSNPVTFFVDNATAVFSRSNATSPDLVKKVLPNIAAPIGSSTIFDWGLPFYYGKRVFTGIDGMSSSAGIGPLFAF